MSLVQADGAVAPDIDAGAAVQDARVVPREGGANDEQHPFGHIHHTEVGVQLADLIQVITSCSLTLVSICFTRIISMLKNIKM